MTSATATPYDIYNVLENNGFPQSEKTTSEERAMQQIKNLLEYAKTTYKCDFPKGLVRTLYKSNPTKKVPPRKVIDAIIKEWEIWKDYLSEESFSSFVIAELKNLFEIHATATSYSRKLGSYVGVKDGVKVIAEPPQLLATCISFKGILMKNGLEQKV